MSDYESLQNEYNGYKSSHSHTNDEFNSYVSSHSHTNDEYNNYGSSQYNSGYGAGFSSALSGSPTSITFSYGGNNWQRTRISPPLITLGHSTAKINISPYGYGQVALLGLAKNGTGWTTVKSGGFNGTIDCSGYAALAIEAGGYEPGYGASGSGTISVN